MKTIQKMELSELLDELETWEIVDRSRLESIQDYLLTHPLQEVFTNFKKYTAIGVAATVAELVFPFFPIPNILIFGAYSYDTAKYLIRKEPMRSYHCKPKVVLSTIVAGSLGYFGAAYWDAHPDAKSFLRYAARTYVQQSMKLDNDDKRHSRAEGYFRKNLIINENSPSA